MDKIRIGICGYGNLGRKNRCRKQMHSWHRQGLFPIENSKGLYYIKML